MLLAGDQAPPFDLPDLEGERQQLDGTPTIAVFWHLAFPYLQRLFEAYPGGGWRLLAVSQDREGPSRDFAHTYGLGFPVLIEGEGWPASQLYDPEATPTLFLIGPAGTIEMTSVGFDKEELNEISRRLAATLGETARVIAEENDGNPSFKPG